MYSCLSIGRVPGINKGRIFRPLPYLSFNGQINSDFPNNNNKLYYHYLSFHSVKGENLLPIDI